MYGVSFRAALWLCSSNTVHCAHGVVRRRVVGAARTVWQVCRAHYLPSGRLQERQYASQRQSDGASSSGSGNGSSGSNGSSVLWPVQYVLDRVLRQQRQAQKQQGSPAVRQSTASPAQVGVLCSMSLQMCAAAAWIRQPPALPVSERRCMFIASPWHVRPY